MKTIAVLTSGGDAPGMNAAIWAVVKVAASREISVIGVERGYDGLVDGAFRPLTRAVVSSGNLVPAPGIDGMVGSGGTLLGTTRCQRFYEASGRQEACRQLTEAGIDGLIVIGGNGTLTGAHLFSQECGAVPVVGVPASIAERVHERLSDQPDVDIRATVLGHVVRGGRPSYHDRMVAGRLALGAVNALVEGCHGEMVAWSTTTEGGTPTGDPRVSIFPLEVVLDETEALLDGSSDMTKRRVLRIRPSRECWL